MKNKHRIFLIGFMGSGKTTLGHAIASHLDVAYVDTDQVIVQSMDLSIPAIFEHYGAGYFRWIEAQYLRQSTADITATGGGAPMYFDSLTWMKSQGQVVFIDTPYDVIDDRLSRSASNRPVANQLTKEQLLKLYNERLDTYKQADLTFRPHTPLHTDVHDLVTLINQLG